MKEKIINYFKDIVKEMKKVSWPTKEQLRDYTKIVILTMLLMSLFVYIVDKGFSEILKVIF
ncbi:MAG: preprotein translocase subunit SecE [Ignavibacteriaceae bacterium]|jgi:preprotein translocase, SecE subunit, bacterial|nr:MAG: preprotein translocase subunit SecE [Chlorobiota bacterium]KXK03139.1 MAG: preprotein translocase subunit SecE [Chlorobi bacterium OLB4]MBW7855013.1 preprotein translocase subunit SecE [Ignavibacteria bacterium]MCE7953755.1 preprotein translocase subunit SecE [Chlorobi bacterium CHB7]MDL1887689.1 preprotein translocase subunit SecE [Ignavibacteria bacterium CHB1]MEB2330312.1 preprotein translocase subunit SecE [Ignavibacteriaceae bacterium]OQY76802.1 MAG: preprotein translocase subuni